MENIGLILDKLDEKYGGKVKGIFMSNDTHANILFNLVIRKFGRLPEDHKIVGFDNSSISREAVFPISTVGQQTDIIADTAMELLMMQINERKKRKPTPLEAPVHKVITPVVFRRSTTGQG